MSTIGTGVAAGVAQTVHQAKQIADRKNKTETQLSRHATHNREIRDALVMSVEEESDGDDEFSVALTDQLPEHQNPPPPSGSGGEIKPDPAVDQAQKNQSITKQPLMNRKTPPGSDLYHHLDIRA